MRKTLLFGILLSSMLAGAAADNAQIAPLNANFKEKLIKKGNVEAAGQFSLGVTNENSENSSLYLAPSLSYFVMDKFSVGMSMTFSQSKWSNSSSQGLGFGPTASYYFAESENWVFHATQAITHSNWVNQYDTSYYGIERTENYSTISTTALGAKYFITPSVAFGIGLYHTSYLQPKESQSRTSDSINGLFSTYF